MSIVSVHIQVRPQIVGTNETQFFEHLYYGVSKFLVGNLSPRLRFVSAMRKDSIVSCSTTSHTRLKFEPKIKRNYH